MIAVAHVLPQHEQEPCQLGQRNSRQGVPSSNPYVFRESPSLLAITIKSEPLMIPG